MKRWRIVLESRAGNQYVQLLARDRAEAEVLANTYMGDRARRHDITFQRLEERLVSKGADKITKAQYDAAMEKRKVDFSRYDVVTKDGVGAADAPLKIAKIEEVK